MWRHQELEEERKSVRFNLDQELDIRFSLSEVSDQEGVEVEDDGEGDWNSDEEDPDEERIIAGIKVSGGYHVPRLQSEYDILYSHILFVLCMLRGHLKIP